MYRLKQIPPHSQIHNLECYADIIICIHHGLQLKHIKNIFSEFGECEIYYINSNIYHIIYNTFNNNLNKLDILDHIKNKYNGSLGT